MEITPVGFVGLGNMGTPMARRIAKGYPLLVYDLHSELAETLAKEAEEVSAAEAPNTLGYACPIVITMLPDASVVRDALLGSGNGTEGAIARAMKAGGLVVDMSSSAPTATQALGRDLEALGIGLIDAPVSGGVPRARDGSLTIMAGGDKDLVERALPILSCMGTVKQVGPLGAGHAMKALNNYVSAAGLLAVSEALIVAEKFDLDPSTLNDVLKASTGRNNTTDRKVEQFMLNRAFDSGFTLALMLKDVGMAHDLARALHLNAPWLAGCKDLLAEASEALGPGADHTAALSYLEKRLVHN